MVINRRRPVTQPDNIAGNSWSSRSSSSSSSSTTNSNSRTVDANRLTLSLRGKRGGLLLLLLRVLTLTYLP